MSNQPAAMPARISGSAALGVGLLLLAVASIGALCFGSVNYPAGEVWQTLLRRADGPATLVVLGIRLPRILTALMVGANLAVSGALLQAVMRNPLADPGLIGVSSGGGLVALTIFLLFPEFSRLVPCAGFLGGMAACTLVFSLAWRQGADPVRLVLAGVAVNAVLGGGIAVLTTLYSDRIQSVVMWMNGSLSGKSWHQVQLLYPYSLLGLLAASLLIKTANLLCLGDEVAKNLGVRVHQGRLLLTAAAAFNAGITVAVVGLIGFVGLMVPHICRFLVGPDYRRLLPLTAVLGAALLIAADCVARTAFSPIELPVGIIMAISGGPFFLYLMRKGGAGRR